MAALSEGKNLLKAIESNDIDDVRALLSKHPELGKGKKRLWKAATLGHHEIVELLIESGANVQEVLTFSKGDNFVVTMTILHWMVVKAVPFLDNHIKVGDLLIKYGVIVDGGDNKGKTPFQYALSEHKIKWIEFLLKNGAKIYGLKWDQREGNLTYSIFNRQKLETRKNVLELLIKHGLGGKVRDASGRNLLLQFIFYFVRDSDSDAAQIADILLDSGLPIDESDKLGFSALHLAVDRQSYKLCDCLVQRGADLDKKTEADDTPLSLAIVHANIDIAELLLSNGADVNVKSTDGRTPLHIACCYHDEDIIELLIENGADMTVEDKNGYTPFMEFEESDDDGCISAMVKQLAKLMKDNQPVSEKDKWVVRENSVAKKHFSNCKAELDDMANNRFYEGWSYYSILKMSSVEKLAKLMENDESVAKYKENLNGLKYFKDDLVRLLEEAVEVRKRSKA